MENGIQLMQDFKVDSLSIQQLTEALFYIPPFCDFNEWCEIGRASKALGISYENFLKFTKLTSHFVSNEKLLKDWNYFNKVISSAADNLFSVAHRSNLEVKNIGNQAIFDKLISYKSICALSIIVASELSEEFDPPNEIVEGLLTSGDGSILYGDSNCGKTFFVIDVACAIARGEDWFGRKTEKGLVIYLATESPASVKRRLQAYQKYYDVRIDNFIIVQNPINLFNGKEDTYAIIDLVKSIEDIFKEKAILIVGDTLARLSAGANENAGQDMGVVVKHFDYIRAKTDAHFMLIHHSGKNAAAGARGWSGVRAAVETEIEITDTGDVRTAEITKQRDLDSKGLRIGFSLEPVILGETKWGKQASSCIVIPKDAPIKQSVKRGSNIGNAICEYLEINKQLTKRVDLVKHYSEKYSKSGIYKEVENLLTKGIIKEEEGFLLLNS